MLISYHLSGKNSRYLLNMEGLGTLDKFRIRAELRYWDNLRLSLCKKLHNWQPPSRPLPLQALAQALSPDFNASNRSALINGLEAHFRQTCLVVWRNGNLFLKEPYSGI